MPIPSVDRPACDVIDQRSMEIWTAVELKNNDDNLREFFIPPTVSRLFASELGKQINRYLSKKIDMRKIIYCQ